MKVLYITYTGITEHLGSSQILPYIIGLAKRGVSYTVISFEPAPLLATKIDGIRNLANGLPIEFIFLERPSSGAKFKKVIAIFKGMRLARRLAKQNKYDFVHCRNAFAAEIALSIKRTTGIPYLLDFRGFWGDARKESGNWDCRKLRGRLIYKIWKWREKNYIVGSIFVNTLTEKAKQWIIDKHLKDADEIYVTPCCVDFSRSDIAFAKDRGRLREHLGFRADEFICIYVGSSGGVYDDDRLLRIFSIIKRYIPSTKFLILGRRTRNEWMNVAANAQILIEKDDINCEDVLHEAVFDFIAIADLGFSFCKPSFYSIGVSSTKISEYTSMGLPFVGNVGIGDLDKINRQLEAGLVLPDTSDTDEQMVTEFIKKLNFIDRKRFRCRANALFDIHIALENYMQAYQKISARKLST